MVSWERIRERRAGQCGQDSRRWEAARASQANLAGARATKPDERSQGAGQDRESRTTPREALGRLRGPASRGPGTCGSGSGRWGTGVPGPHGRAGDAGQHVVLEGPLGATPGSPPVSRTRQHRAEPAQRAPAMGLHHVWHVIDGACWRAASRPTWQSRAPGVAQVPATPEAAHRDANLRALHARRRAHRSVAPPVERVGSAKDEGKQRPRGPPGFEDKMVQRAVVMRWEALFEHEFEGFAQGLRPGPRPPQALHERRAPCRPWHSAWRVDAAVRGCCDHLAWGPRREGLQQRVREGGRWRRRGTGRQAGGRASGARTSPDQGAPPGGVLAPMGSQVCRPRVWDAWGVKDVPPRRHGRGLVTRCADDGRLGCALAAEARRGRDVLPRRLARFRRTRPPEQTVWTACQRPPRRHPSAGGTGTFDVLGLTHDWATTRRGDGVIKRQTVGKRLRRCRQGIGTWCRENRPAPLQEPSQTGRLPRRGSDPYEGIRGHCTRRAVVVEPTERAGPYGRSRRRHQGPITGQQFVEAVHRQRPRPQPRIMPHISERRGQPSEAPNGVSPVW
jgi:hypothetical protein